MASKRKNVHRISVSSLHEALELVENHGIVRTMEDAAEVWQSIGAFRPAQVLFASECIAAEFFAETRSESVEAMIHCHLEVYHEISDCREFKCCRGPAIAKHMQSSKIVEAVQPLMQKGKKRGKTKLSYYSELIDVLMKFTHVNVDYGRLDEWEPVEDWINTTISSFPLLAEIVDPSFMIIRGNGGGAPPAWIQTVLDAIPVGRQNGGLSAPAVAANVQVRRAPGQPPIPNMYQFPDMADARAARTALQTHANTLAIATGNPLPGVQLDILRLNVLGGGMVWI